MGIDMALTIRGKAEVAGLSELRIFADGHLVQRKPLSGQSADLIVEVVLPGGTRWLSALLADRSGTESTVQTISLPKVGSNAHGPKRRLFTIAVGTDVYSSDRLPPLQYAKSDAAKFNETARAVEGAYYSEVNTQSLYDDPTLKSSLPKKIRELVSTANDWDTIMLFIAGHGVQDRSGRYYLATKTTDLNKLSESALAWDELAGALKDVKARVIVFLDACHSGAASDEATNDQAVSRLVQSNSAIMVVAAAKGRQSSFEGKSWGSGGGAFAATLADVVSNRMSTDENSDGVIELSELYKILKARVVASTGGAQTPWISRNQMVGEIPLF